MTQLTIRTDSKELEVRLRELASERGWSLNQAANYLLQKGAGLVDAPSQRGIASQLDEFIGSWSKTEARAFEDRIAGACGGIDPGLWE